MATRMLIDARHPEETRVAVLKGNRIEEFDFESAEHKQIKGNIYLAKVTRVEPSLQAAFVDFGGNRHGFLAFSEIHPDYYQIPPPIAPRCSPKSRRTRRKRLRCAPPKRTSTTATKPKAISTAKGPSSRASRKSTPARRTTSPRSRTATSTTTTTRTPAKQTKLTIPTTPKAKPPATKARASSHAARRGRGRRQGGGRSRAKEMDELQAPSARRCAAATRSRT